MDADDSMGIVLAVNDMLQEQVSDPFSTLVLALVLELIVADAIDYERLGKTLTTEWKNWTPEQRASQGGRVLDRIRRVCLALAQDPEGCLAALESAGHSAASPGRPQWLRAIIDGGKPDRPDQSS